MPGRNVNRHATPARQQRRKQIFFVTVRVQNLNIFCRRNCDCPRKDLEKIVFGSPETHIRRFQIGRASSASRPSFRKMAETLRSLLLLQAFEQRGQLNFGPSPTVAGSDMTDSERSMSSQPGCSTQREVSDFNCVVLAAN